MLNVIRSFFQVILLDKSASRFVIGITFGFAFSIAVILSTVGIMDGFEWSLKLGLKKSMGDLNFYSREGNFDFEKDVLPRISTIPKNNLSPLLETQAFVVSNGTSKGTLVKGVNQTAFSSITGLKLNFKENEVAVGVELARFLNIKIGDDLVMALPGGNSQLNELPSLESFKVGQIVSHGIYQKDLRFIYINLSHLQELLELKNMSNTFVMKSINKSGVNYLKDSDAYMKSIESTQEKIEDTLGVHFYGKPFWEDFSFLLRAVATEKYMIGLILQLVVVISIFNVLAFVIYINEKRARELFLFQALGMSPNKIFSYMMSIIFFIWTISCLLSVVLVKLLDFLLINLSIFELPGEIYTLGSLSIKLDTTDYIVVFLSALFWLSIMSWIGLSRLRKKSILQGLRREFA